MIKISKILRAARREACDGEEGFSIVELLASLTVLAIGIISLLGTLVVAARAAGTQRGRVNAVYAANLVFENVRSKSYENIAIWDQDPDIPISPTTETQVSGAVRTAVQEESIPIRQEPIVLAGVTYELLLNVLWVPYNDTVTGQYYEKAYKLVVVKVSWRDHIGPHSIQLESAFYPGGLGETEASCGFTGPIIQPTEVTATMPTESTPSVFVSWIDAANNECKYELQVLVLPSPPLQCEGAGWEIQWIAVGDLPSDTQQYVYAGQWEKTYCFRVRAVNRDNAASPGVPVSDWVYSNPVTTPLPPNPFCVISNPVVRSPGENPNTTPNRVQIHASTGFNVDSIVAAVETTGICARVWAIFIDKNGQQVDTGDFILTGSQAFVQLPARWQQFGLGYSNVTFKARGARGQQTQAIATVCYYKGGGGKSSC